MNQQGFFIFVRLLIFKKYTFMESIMGIVSLLSIIIGLIILIRWWSMTTDIKHIRKLLEKNQTNKGDKENSKKVSVLAEIKEDDKTEVDKLKAKLKPDQCIVKVKANSKIEIWNKSDWNDVLNKGRENMFLLLFHN